MLHHDSYIFADGSCLKNPGPGGWGALCISNKPTKTFWELGASSLDNLTTNNRMELTALIEGLLSVHQKNGPQTVLAFCDSVYVIDGYSSAIKVWMKNNWLTSSGSAVKNQNLWEELILAASLHVRLDFKHVRGHQGIIGNERVDVIANSFSCKNPLALLSGAWEQSVVPIEEALRQAQATSHHQHSDKKAKIKSTSNGPFYYIAWDGRQLHKFTNWDACKKFVEGRANMRFKKVGSQQEETQILSQWGIRL